MLKPDICGIEFSDFVIRMEEFHGYRSPGILCGGLMIDAALKALATTPYLNVVTETVVCLPDAVQLLTPCTIGNGFLQIFDWGKFALTSYDRTTLVGVRASLDYDKLSSFKLIFNWFERSNRNKEKPPFDDLAQEILQASQELILLRPVHLHRALKDTQKVPTGRCLKCGESYPLHHGSPCLSCQGNAYYCDTATGNLKTKGEGQHVERI